MALIAAGVVVIAMAACGVTAWIFFTAMKSDVATRDLALAPAGSPPVARMPSGASILLVVPPTDDDAVAPELAHGLYWVAPSSGALVRWTTTDAGLFACTDASLVVHAGGASVLCNDRLSSYAPDGSVAVRAVVPPEARSGSVLPQAQLRADGSLAWTVDTADPTTCIHRLQVYSDGLTPTAVPDALRTTTGFGWTRDGSAVLFGSSCDAAPGCVDPYHPPPPTPDCLRRASATDGTLTELWRTNGDGIVQSVFPSPAGDRALVFVGHGVGPALYDVDLAHHTAMQIAPLPPPPGDVNAPQRKHWLDLAWSPDGASVVVLSDDETRCLGFMPNVSCDVALYLMSPDGSHRRRLGSAVAAIGLVGWGP